MKNFFYRTRFLAIVIILPVILLISYQNFRNVETIINSKYMAHQNLVESSILNTVQYADNTYRLIEDQMTEKIKKYTQVLLTYYQKNPDPHNWNLTELKNLIPDCNLTVIDNKLTKIKFNNQSALEPESGLPDLLEQLKSLADFNSLIKILPRKVDRLNRDDRLIKYNYILTPDQKYLLEMGFDITEKYYLITQIDIYSLADRLASKFDTVDGIRIFKFSGNGEIIGEINQLPDNALFNNLNSNNDIKSYIKTTMLDNRTLEFTGENTDLNHLQRFKFIPYLNYDQTGNINWWISYFVEIIYNDSIFNNELKSQHHFFLFNVLLISLIFIVLLLIVSYLFRRLEQDRQKLETVINRTSEGYCMLNSELEIMEINNSFVDMTDYQTEELIGRNLNDLLQEQDGEIFSDLINNKQTHQRYDKILLRKNNIPVHVVINATAIFENHKLAFIFAFISDVSEQKKNEEYINHIAHHDFLTGLPNRLAFEKKLKQALRAARKNQTKLAVMFLDLNNFKSVNDTYGHNTGDRLLKQVAHKLEKGLRKNDIISRLGGDEFTILLPDIESRDDAIRVSIKLLNAFQEPFNINDRHFYVKPSIGISLFPDDGIEPEKLVKKADQAMYQAKSGKKHYKVFSQDIS